MISVLYPCSEFQASVCYSKPLYVYLLSSFTHLIQMLGMVRNKGPGGIRGSKYGQSYRLNFNLKLLTKLLLPVCEADGRCRSWLEPWLHDSQVQYPYRNTNICLSFLQIIYN